jgi:hypothetical protein
VAAARDQAHPQRAGHHLHLRHPRPGGGARALRPHRDLPRRPDRPARDRGGPLRAPADALRGRVRRRLERAARPRRGRGGARGGGGRRLPPARRGGRAAARRRARCGDRATRAPARRRRGPPGRRRRQHARRHDPPGDVPGLEPPARARVPRRPSRPAP